MDEGSRLTRLAKVCITVSDNEMVTALSREENCPINCEFERWEAAITYISRLMLNLCV
jgi:hypothetical protein